ncbi:hypothetical protein [Aequorivita xiaoshiensis]|uniref:Uncharacterized protein n=1 Tax=Aequorivita xiaoshiensis TaxID=2874476 RepID=A0A9X1R377_9FLAO|nr:hypothetical protein [Aequorivita xiaoshiensis]MCG2431087.1 hypothetical protein [Aequorivita xiaoshiensis]
MSKKENGENTELENANLDKQELEVSSTNNESKIEPEIVSDPEGEEDSFTEKWKNNRFLLIRGTYYLLHSIWMVIMVVGGFIAWLIALLFI